MNEKAVIKLLVAVASGYEFRYVKGHVEVYLHGLFQFAADTFAEAREELNNIAN